MRQNLPFLDPLIAAHARVYRFKGAYQMHQELGSIRPFSLALAFAICATTRAYAQECPLQPSNGPSTASKVRSLEGQLVFHNDIRGWFELKLNRSECGHASIQLLPTDAKSKSLQVFRGCRIRSSGALAFSPTGYYSADIFQDVEKVEPLGKCVMQRAFPDYSSAKPDKLIRAYTVDMHIDYRPGDHPLEFRVHSGGRELRPWQAYASYMLTGGYVLYGMCADGFVVDKVRGTAAAKPGHFADPDTPDDRAEFDPEGAAAAGTTDLHLGFTCIREPNRKR